MFKRLNLDRDNLIDCISRFCSEELGLDLSPALPEIRPNHHRCTITTANREFATDFFFRKDGTTTINPKVGKDHSMSTKLALYIKKKLCTTTAKNFSFSIPNLPNEIANLLVEYICDLEGIKKLNEDKHDNYILFRFKGKYGDKIVIKIYTNGTLQVQGKPLQLYQEVLYFLAEFQSLKDLVNVHSEYFCVKIDATDIDEEINTLLPYSRTFLGEHLIKILSASVVYKQIDIDFDDYSSFVFPVLRALEGYIKKLFSRIGVTVDKKFEQFNCNDGVFTLKRQFRIQCGASNVFSAIEEAYNYLNQQRHSLFHAEQIDIATRIIGTKAEADIIINDTLEIIESTYCKFNNISRGVSDG